MVKGYLDVSTLGFRYHTKCKWKVTMYCNYVCGLCVCVGGGWVYVQKDMCRIEWY